MFVFNLFQVFLDFQASQVALDFLVRLLGQMFEDLQETLAYLVLMDKMVNTSLLIILLFLCISFALPCLHDHLPVLFFPLQVSKVVQDHQAHLVQAQLKETEVTPAFQAFRDPLAEKENLDCQQALELPVVLV